METRTIHIFSGRFGSLEAAQSYCERDWGDAPDEDDAPEAWEVWESKFPRWALKDDLGVYLDEDFMELTFGPDRASHINALKLSQENHRHIEQSIEADDSLLIIDELALGGFNSTLQSTPRLRYLGSFQGQWA